MIEKVAGGWEVLADLLLQPRDGQDLSNGGLVGQCRNARPVYILTQINACGAVKELWATCFILKGDVTL